MEDEFEITEEEAIANPFTDAQYNESEDRFLKWYKDNGLFGVKTDIDVCKYSFFEGERQAKDIIEKLLNAFASNDFFTEEELSVMHEAEEFLGE